MQLSAWHWVAIATGAVLLQANALAMVQWACEEERPRLYGWQSAANAGAAMMLLVILIVDWLSGKWSGLFLWYLAGYLGYVVVLSAVLGPWVRRRRIRMGWLIPQLGVSHRARLRVVVNRRDPK